MSNYQMQPYQQRVMNEATELDEKISKLDNFIGYSDYRNLEEIDRVLLDTQLLAMKMYSGILHQRIRRFQLPPQSK
ncbi:hypothetical protein ID852_19795 [Xenorhabdus sp. 42]|uniref:crAss001_48 related protein n=1 Tax=Xenorhabdus szentirmaii TaxID=290112 RepID=UPI00199FD635|nr:MULTISPECIES: hypothetical protein [unclassified Xenorhabdus]MBD2781939.1 hypothetical protein [Xenorhabdus sp. 38]MBD2822865.1 hypothetical protein [Xenorhabdus sp. 42]